MITFNELGRYGQLGNGMFQVAATIGLAVDYGFDYGFPQWNDNAKGLVPFNLPISERKSNVINVGWDTDPYDFLETVELPDECSLHGHFQSEGWFCHVEDTIREIFTFKAIEHEKLPDNAIAIHVRRGDYDGAYHNHISAQSYKEAIRDIKAIHGDIPVYVFSDEPDKAYAELKEKSWEFVPVGNFVSDLATMSTATHFVIANSTYSWWGAWLGYKGGEVYAPDQWFGWKYKNMTSNHIIPNWWKKYSC